MPDTLGRNRGEVVFARRDDLLIGAGRLCFGRDRAILGVISIVLGR